MDSNPISSNSSPTPYLNGTSFKLGAPPFPGLKPLDPSSPWFQFFQKIFPHVQNQQELGTDAAIFEKNMFEMLRQQIEKDRKKSHEEAQKVKKLLTGED